MTGCGSGESALRAQPARRERGSAGAAPPDAPAVDPDSDLVLEMGRALSDALTLTLSTAAAHRPTRSLARRFTRLHRAHLQELGRPADVATSPVEGPPQAARTRLLRLEEQLQQELVRAALAAESGALAQVFAAMAAAIAQERAVAG